MFPARLRQGRVQRAEELPGAADGLREEVQLRRYVARAEEARCNALPCHALMGEGLSRLYKVVPLA